MDLNKAYEVYESSKRDRAAMNALMLQVRDYARAKAYKRNREHFADIAHDIVIRVSETFHSFRPDRGNFRAWVATLAANYIATCHRSAKRQIQAEQEPEDAALDTLHIVYSADELPNRDVRGLPTDLQRIVSFLTLGYTKEETANRLGCSVRRIEQIIKQHIDKQAAA